MTYELWQMPYGGTGDPRCDEFRARHPASFVAARVANSDLADLASLLIELQRVKQTGVGYGLVSPRHSP